MASISSFSGQFPTDILHEIFEFSIDPTDQEIFGRATFPTPLIVRYPPRHPRRTIPHICREWNTLSKPILWRTVILTSEESAKAMLTRLKRAHDDNMSLSNLIQRLVVRVGRGESVEDWGDDKNDIIQEILELCSSVRVIQLIDITMVPETLKLVTQNPHLKMLVVTICSSDVVRDGHRFPALLKQLSGQLDSLHLRIDARTGPPLCSLLRWLDIPHMRLSYNTHLESHHGNFFTKDMPLWPIVNDNPHLRRLEMSTLTTSVVQDIRYHREQFDDVGWGKLYYSTINNEIQHLKGMIDMVQRYRLDLDWDHAHEEAYGIFRYNWLKF